MGLTLIQFDLGSRAWAQLPSAASVPSGTRAWCSDYPGPSGGVEVLSNRVRWRPTSQQHVLMNYQNGSSGLTVAAGASEALFGVTRLVKGGMLAVGDHLRLTAYIQQVAASSSGARRLRVRNATTEGGLLSGVVPISYRTVATSQYTHVVDKSGILLTSTAGKTVNDTSNAAASIVAALYDMVINNLAADQYVQFSAENASDQSMVIYGATLFVEFGS